MIKFSATLLATLIAASVNVATVDLRGQERCAKLNHQGHPFIIGNTKEKGE